MKQPTERGVRQEFKYKIDLNGERVDEVERIIYPATLSARDAQIKQTANDLGTDYAQLYPDDHVYIHCSARSNTGETIARIEYVDTNEG